MGAAIEITRKDHTAAMLRGLAAKATGGAEVRRLLALALVLEGHRRDVAAERSGMGVQTLRDWVLRYNAAGVEGLRSVRTGGRTALLNEAQMAELRALTVKGPDPETDKVVDTFRRKRSGVARLIRLEGTMRRAVYILIATLGFVLADPRSLSATPAPEVQQALAPKSTLRVALLLGDATQALKDATSGELKGVGFDLGRNLAQRIGVPFEPVLYPSIGALLDKGMAGDWDVAFIGFTPARAKDWDFAPPHLEVEFGYLVPAGSPIATIADADRPGVQVAVQERSGPDAFLSRSLKNAVIVRTPDYASAVGMQKLGKVDVIFSIKPILYDLSGQMPGSRVLGGSPGKVPQAMAMPKGRDAGIPYARSFIEVAKAEGIIKAAIERAGLRGVIIPANQTPSR